MDDAAATPCAVVLSHALTGYATIRALAAEGVCVLAVTFDENDPVHRSRRCRSLCLAELKDDRNALAERLIKLGEGHRERPVLLPTSDADALMIARNRDRLKAVYRVWETEAETLESIVRKDGLERLARAAGLATVPSIIEPSVTELERWAASHPGPYLVKPFYQGHEGSNLSEKNRRIDDRQGLLGYVREWGTDGLVIQRMLRGGDGYVFDCYGLCNAGGEPLVMASHRRWRQMPPDQGWTSFGEIPAAPEGHDESILFDRTRRLLEQVRYHGIFGIEWLQDRDSGELYPIDFNARPFSSIGHLHACGLNLPWLAWCDLRDEPMHIDDPTPTLKHLYWVDLIDDFRSFTRARDRIAWTGWLGSLLRCRAFAWFSWSDPLPAAARLSNAVRSQLRKMS